MVCGWGDHRQATLTSLAREWGIVVACTIRRLPTSEREDSNLVVAMRGTPVAGRPGLLFSVSLCSSLFVSTVVVRRTDLL